MTLSMILTVLIFIGAVSIIVRYQRDMSTARKRVDSLHSQVIETACGAIEYARVGNGYPVLVVHGAMGGFDQGLLTVRDVIDEDFQVISISRFGYLRSPMPENADFNLQADAYVCLLDVLNISRVAVFAASGGANSSIRFAARYPERTSALILLEPASPGDIVVESPPKVVIDTLMRSDFIYWVMCTYFKSSMQSMIGVPQGFVLSPEMQTGVDEVLTTTLPSSERIDGMIFDTYTSSPEFYEEISETNPYSLSKIETQVLVISTLDDPLAVPENVHSLSEKFPHSRLFVLPDGGHFSLGHAQEIKAEITQFLHSSLPELVSKP